MKIKSRQKRGNREKIGNVNLFLIFGASVVLSMIIISHSFLSNSVFEFENNAFAPVLASSKVSFGKSGGSSCSEHTEPRSYVYSWGETPIDSPYRMQHTVLTRFMVGQASQAKDARKQTELTWARYLLFETFCWPTVRYQTSMNFYWIVLVDPGVEKEVIDGMRNLMSSKYFPLENAFLVLTNNTVWAADGINIPGVTTYGVGLQPVAEEFRNGTVEILTGNTDLLLRGLDRIEGNDDSVEKEKPLMVIETVLDCDDGLNNLAVEWIQTASIGTTKEHWQGMLQEQLLVMNKTAHKTAIQQPHLSPSLPSTWWFYCGSNHIEWHNREIYRSSKTRYSEGGISSGLAGLREKPVFVNSAGFSRIGITTTTGRYSSGSSEPPNSHMTFPKESYENHAYAFWRPPCTTTPPTDAAKGNYSNCWRREKEEEVFVMNSRTITSDSMDHMGSEENEFRDRNNPNNLIIKNSERMWHILETQFSINRTKAWETSIYLFDNRESIIKQNVETRCAPGFPCSPQAGDSLREIQNYFAKLDGVSDRPAK